MHTINGRDIISDSRFELGEHRVASGGNPTDTYMYFGSFVERISIDRPDWDSPLRRIAWSLGRRTLRRTMHVVQFPNEPITEVCDGFYRDELTDSLAIDVSV